MERQLKAYLYASVTVLLWSTVASAFKLTLNLLSFAEMLFYASLTSLLFLAGVVLISQRATELRRWSRKEILRSLPLGLLNPALYYLIVFKSYDLLPAQEAQLLNFTWPIVLVLFSAIVLSQRVRAKTLLAMGISFLGVMIISTRGDVLGWQITDALGVSLALGSTVIWSLYWTLGVKDARDPVLRLMLNFFFGFLWVALYMLIFEAPRVPPILGLLGSVYIGLFEMGLTFLMWLQALRLSRTTAQVSALIYLTPLLSLVVIHFTVGEPVYGSTLMGMVLILGGIFLQHYGHRLAGSGIRSSG